MSFFHSHDVYVCLIDYYRNPGSFSVQMVYHSATIADSDGVPRRVCPHCPRGAKTFARDDHVRRHMSTQHGLLPDPPDYTLPAGYVDAGIPNNPPPPVPVPVRSIYFPRANVDVAVQTDHDCSPSTSRQSINVEEEG